MNFIKNLFLYIFSCLVLLTAGIYLCFLFVLPPVFNSNVTGLGNFLCRQTGIKMSFEGVKLKTTPLLHVKLDVLELSAADTGEIKDLYADINLLDFSKSIIQADLIKINIDKIFELTSRNKDKKTLKPFNFRKLPEISAGSLVVEFNKNTLIATNVNINAEKASFNAEIKTPFLDDTLIISDKGHINFDGESAYAKDLEVKYGTSAIYLNGKLTDNRKNIDLHITGENLPVRDIENTLLFYQKSQDPAKKFIENFKDYKGSIDIDLNLKHDGIYGKCTASKLSARAVWFEIPLYFEKVVFNFDKDKITSKAQGLVGGQKAVHTLNINHLGGEDKEVTGNLSTVLGENFKYVPELRILHSVNAEITYNIKRKKITVDYNLEIPEQSDILYKNAYLGLRDSKRRFSAQTLKDNNDLKLTKYDYSIINNGTIKNIITGNGLFKKINGKFNPQFITCKTNGFAPASVTGSFGRYVHGGEFNGNLKYNFISKEISGNFELINTRFKDYFVKSAKILADKKINIKAEGTYLKEKFFCDLSARNKLTDEIYVYNLSLFLDKYIVKKRHSRKHKSMNLQKLKELDISSKVKESEVTIENWKINVNTIKKDRLVLNDIELIGSLKNDVFTFTMSKLWFAKGTLFGNGKYDFRNDSSSLDVTAEGINSNTAADVLFNLPGEVEGIANASLHIETKRKLDDIQAKGDFSIENGFLPKLGSTEFMIKNNKKIKAADLINVDFTKKKAFESDIKGSFYMDNSLLKDIRLTSRQKYLSLFITGEYEIHRQHAKMRLFGKYNKEAPKGVKILFIPLNLILKVVFRPENTMDLYRNELKQIPPIETEKANEKYFRVKLEGNLNKDNVDVEIKGIHE